MEYAVGFGFGVAFVFITEAIVGLIQYRHSIKVNIPSASNNKQSTPCVMCGKSLSLSDTICKDCRDYAS